MFNTAGARSQHLSNLAYRSSLLLIHADALPVEDLRMHKALIISLLLLFFLVLIRCHPF